MKLILLIGLLLISRVTNAQGIINTDKWPLHITIGSYMTLQGIDLATTEYALGTQKFVEGNSLVAPFSNSPVKMGAIKMGVAVGTSYLLLRYHTDHPKAAFWIAITANIICVGVVTHNARLIK